MKTIRFNSKSNEQYSWLSNFEPSPIVDLNGYVWPTVEHCYQAAKTTGEEREAIRLAETPGRAKRLGQRCTVRSDWNDIKIEAMRRILVAKFTQNPELYTLLLNCDGVELVEYAPWGDRFWGDGGDGSGQNHLGKLLMQLRDAWLEESPTTVVNIKEVPGAEYIGRAGQGMDGYFGNPIRRGQKCDRCGVNHIHPSQTLPCFAYYFHERLLVEPDFKEAVLQLKGAELGCFCKTKSGVGNPCHGDVISLWLNNYGA